MSINVYSLGSGSKGNCFIVSDGKSNIMIDAGLSINSIIRGLQKIGLDIFDIAGILVTHEHSDHIRSIQEMSSYSNVYSHKDTFNAINSYLDGREINNKIEINEQSELEIGSFFVKPFNVFHDAAHPLGFNIFSGNEKLSYLTDTGKITDNMKQKIKGSDILVIESNHDIEMLKKGVYPYVLKKRILSETGHLANVDCAKTVLDLAKNNTKKVLLAHLSENNNLKELAYWETEKLLQANGATKEDVELKVATQREIIII
ncbi:MAG: MBL fold metallo-hydrolase [Clostridia bacterium]|nr:MBL fold metallo-hydrolase [Clostridia bacterium]